MPTQTQLREGTGSRFMNAGATQTIQYATDGQGGVSATASAGACVNATAANPAVIDCIQIDSVVTSAVTVNIRNAGNSATLFSVVFPTSATTQTVNLGALGVQIDQNWGTTSSGGTHTGLKVFYRFGL